MLVVAAGALFAAALTAAELAVPPLKARVTDQTGTLDSGQRAALEARLAAFEEKKGSQIAVLIVPSTAPETIEQYSIRVVDSWKLGRKGVDDGALLLVAKNDRRMRIEVGRGLEGALPDAITKRIVDEHIAPRFKEGDFYGGINAGVDRMVKVIDGEALPPPATRQPASRFGFDWIELLIVGLVVGSIVNAVLRPMASRLGAAALTGGGVGFLMWVLAGTIAAAVIGGIAMFLFALFSGSAGRRGWSSGGWRSGGWGGGLGGGGWSSGGGGGGGFSGGGGGFSGGGASGSW